MSEVDKRNAQRIAAVKTLQSLGYTYQGGEMWNSPHGMSAAQLLDEIERLKDVIARNAVYGMRTLDSDHAVIEDARKRNV